jgi:hypothetical protein
MLLLLPREALRAEGVITGIARAKNTVVRIRDTYRMVGE